MLGVAFPLQFLGSSHSDLVLFDPGAVEEHVQHSLLRVTTQEIGIIRSRRPLMLF